METIIKQVISGLFEGVFAITLNSVNYMCEKEGNSNGTTVIPVEYFIYEVIYGKGAVAIVEVRKFEKGNVQTSFVDFYQVSPEKYNLLESKIYNNITQDWENDGVFGEGEPIQAFYESSLKYIQ